MWSYLQSFVGSNSENQDSSDKGILAQSGLGQALAPAPTAPAQTRFRNQRDSYEALQKVIEGHKKLKKNKRGRRGAKKGLSYMQGEGLGLLLGEDTTNTPRSFFDEEDTSIQEDESSSCNHKQHQDTTPSETILSVESSQATSVVVAQYGQFRSIRSDAVILESLKSSLEEIQHTTPHQTTLQQQQQQLQQESKNNIVVQNGVMRRNVSMDILRQNVEQVVKRRSSDNDIQQRTATAEDDNDNNEVPSHQIQELDLPPAVQNYLQDRKDLLMRAEQFEELPPDFDNRSVISETRSMPDIKRPESPVARPPIVWGGSLAYSRSSNRVANVTKRRQSRADEERLQMLTRCTSTANSPQLKRPISFSDKVPSVHLKGPTGIYIPDIFPSPTNSFTAPQPPRIQSIKESEQEQSDRMTELTLKAESEIDDDNRSENFDLLVSEMKRKEQVLQRQLSQGSVKDPPEGDSLQINYHKNKFNFEQNKSRKQRRSSQSSETSSISEAKYEELLNTWKAKHREFIKRTQKQHSRRYGRARPLPPRDQEIDQAMSQTEWMDLRNCLSIPEAQELFNRLQEDDLQSVQSEPLNLQTVKEIIQQSKQNNQNVNFSTQPLSRTRSLLKIIEEGRDDINVYPDVKMLPSGQVTVFTTTGASSSDGTLIQF